MSYSSLEYIKTRDQVTSDFSPNSRIIIPIITSSILGVLIGGPIGLLVVNLTHMGLTSAVITEITSVILGIITTNKIRQRPYFRVTFNLPPSKTQILLKQCFTRSIDPTNVNVNVPEHAIINLYTLLCDDIWLSNWYQSLLKSYYKHKSKNIMFYVSSYSQKLKINDFNLSLVKKTLDDMVHDLITILLNMGELMTLDGDLVTLVYSCCEYILMSSLFYDLWEMSQYKAYRSDKIYRKNRGNIKLEMEIDPRVIKCLNILPLKKTASHRINILTKVCNLLSNNQYIGCDKLLIGFINHLTVSNIQNPFSEIVVIETLLPRGLTGLEAYTIATFQASVHYILDASV